jgi:hypothetical protein
VAKQAGRDFAAPARKYTGRVQIDSGPVPITRWQRPYTRAERDRPLGAEGVDLRPERVEHQTTPPPHTRVGTDFNRPFKPGGGDGNRYRSNGNKR